MQHCDALIAPRWCAPVAPPGAVLEDHAVAVTSGRILELLPLEQAQQKYQPSVLVERPQHLLIPGLVNAHTHAAMTLFRGMSDDLPLKAWLEDAIWPAEKRWVSAELVRDGTQLAISEMLKSGTTCFSDQYWFPEIVAETAIDMHMRALVGTPVLDMPTAWAASAAEYLRKGSDLVHDPYAGHPLIKTCFVPHSTYVLSDASFVELRVVADQLDLPVQIHLHETVAEVEQSLAQYGKRPLQRLTDLGLANSSLLAVHAVHMTEDETRQMAAIGICVAHCPTSNLKLASGFAPIQAYLDAGITVGLGTDSAASNNKLDMLAEMRMAALLAKGVAGDAAALSAAEALHMATLGSAAAIGMAEQIGSIEPGKWADLVCVDMQRSNSQPVYDPVSQLVYTANAEQVSDVWVGGRQQLERGRLLSIKEDDIFKRSNEWRERIARDRT
ncbi:MAG: TRZ/ATZ family hydrolase [Woeseiaceae bacterium]